MSTHPTDPTGPREPTQPMGAADGAAAPRVDVRDPAPQQVDLRESSPGGPTPYGGVPHGDPLTGLPSSAAASPGAAPGAGAPHVAAAPPAPAGADHRPHDPSHERSPVDQAADQLSEPDNQAKLLMAMAVLLFLTFLATLALLVDRLADAGGEQPVVIDGVPCLVQEGEGDEAVLYCQR